jgi:hypothetical protein
MLKGKTMDKVDLTRVLNITPKMKKQQRLSQK